MSLATETLAVVSRRFLLLQFFYGFGRNWGASDTDGQPQRRGRRATGTREGGPVARTTRSVRDGAQGTKTNIPDNPTSINLPSRSHTHTINTTCLASQPPQPSFRCLTTHTRSWGWVVKHRPPPAPTCDWLAKPHSQARNKGVGPVASRRKPDILRDNKHD